MRDQKSELHEKIMQTRDLDDAAMKAVTDAIGEFQKQYASKAGAAATVRV